MKYSRQEIQSLIRQDRRFVWHPFTQMRDFTRTEPVIISHGRGNYLYDIRGRRYLDGISSLWVTVHGHNHPALNRAIKTQVDHISHSTLLGLGNVPATELAKRLVQIAPRGLKKVFFSDNGSTAVEIALKMAYQYQRQTDPKSRRNRFLTFAGAYHGDTLGSVGVGGIDLFHKVYKPLLLCNVISDFRRFKTDIARHKNKLAAVIVEPMIQGAAGMILQPRGFLKHLRRACDRHGITLIFDEVATGFGRTGKMFACEHENVAPDILCVAKGLSGGYLPVAATLTTRRIYNGFLADYAAFKTFFHGHTFTGNPLACAAAVANLDIFNKNRVLASLQPKIRLLKNELAPLANNPHVKEIRQLGFMVGIEICATRQPLREFSPGHAMGARVCLQARRYGLMLRPLGNVIVLMPPLSISVAEIRFMVRVITRCLTEVLR